MREAQWRYRTGYLQSAHWRGLRQQVLARCGGICEACGNALATQVHHLSYRRRGEEDDADLQAVCRGCHERLHPGEAIQQQEERGWHAQNAERWEA